VYRQHDEKHIDYQPLPQKVLLPWLATMGQVLFAPPNVKGWRGGTDWLNTATLLARDNFAEALTTGTLWGRDQARTMPTALDPARLIHEREMSDPEEIARALFELYLPGGVHLEPRAKIAAFLAAGKPTGAVPANRVREATHAILAMAEYQLA
jgi:hypothetical protein